MVDVPTVMAAVLLTGHGGYERLVHRTDVPVPRPGPGEVLVRVLACGLNNTDVNTRIGWYSSSVRGGTTGDTAAQTDGGWGGAIAFPLIQGADVCGTAIAVGAGVEGADVIGRRVLIDPWILDPADPGDLAAARYFGSDVDGGFAEWCVAPARNVHPVDSAWSDAELATFACSASTAENLLTKTAVAAGQSVVVSGASGGVGTAVLQLARARGAHVIAVASAAKTEGLAAIGADVVVDRNEPDLAAALRRAAPAGAIHAVVDVVGGSMLGPLLGALTRGGHYASAGAIAGPIVELDWRTVIYGDLHLDGATVCPPGTFARVVEHIEAGRLRPVLAATYPLAKLVAAQQAFVAKQHVGNIVVTMGER
jgi:NADPH:quinone reductase-like Zn-dependent oxidoreductase